MAQEKPVRLTRLTTGVPGLDDVLGGGIPEYSFNIIAGEPGSGKTTLVHQLLFANATVDRPALYFTALGEPPIKMLRYQQQLGFFDVSKVGSAIRFVDLAAEVQRGDLDGLLAGVIKVVNDASPAIVVVDSFRSVIPSPSAERGYDVKAFLQQLAMHLTSWQATTFLLGEYSEEDVQANPVFTVCDGLIWMFQSRDRNSVVRRLQIKKMRGAAPTPGIHTFRISDDGIRVFPRAMRRPVHDRRPYSVARLSTGIPTLDEMLRGGIPCGDSTLVAGPTGVGKTLLGTQFIAEGLKRGEPGVIAVFEEHPDDYIQRAKELGFDLTSAIDSGKLKLVYLHPLDLSVDETLLNLREAIDANDARRFVIDSLTGFELALAPNFREDFRDALYRMVGALTSERVTTLMIVEVTEHFHELSFSPHAISFLTENIVLLRYVEIDGLLEKVVAVVKMRRSEHSRELRGYEITNRGLVVTARLREYEGVLTGAATPRSDILRLEAAELTAEDARILAAMTKLGPAGAEAIAGELGITVVELAPALRRLVVLAYAVASMEGEVVTYRPVGSLPAT